MAILDVDVVFESSPLPIESVVVLLAIFLSLLLVLLSGEHGGELPVSPLEPGLVLLLTDGPVLLLVPLLSVLAVGLLRI